MENEPSPTRFVNLSEEEMQRIMEDKDALNTKKATKQAVNCFLLSWSISKQYDKLRVIYNNTVMGFSAIIHDVDMPQKNHSFGAYHIMYNSWKVHNCILFPHS